MKLRLNDWRYYLVALTALAAIATGIAATPLRKSLTPFVTRPLGSWSLPVARSTGQATPATEFHASSAVASRADELEGLAALSDRKLAPAGADLAQGGEVVEHGGGGAASGQGNGRQGDDSGYRNESSARAFRLGRWGSTSFAGGGRPAFYGSGSIGRAGSTASSNGSSSASASAGGGSGSGSGSGAGTNDSGPIFNEHKAGLPELTGTTNLAPGAGAVLSGQSTLASNPEPSTLILFGTGLMTAVGSIRRRLRRQ